MSFFSNLKQLVSDMNKIAEQDDLTLREQIQGIFKATEAAANRREADEKRKEESC